MFIRSGEGTYVVGGIALKNSKTVFSAAKNAGEGVPRWVRSIYNFAVDGGAIGAIKPLQNGQIPANAIVYGGIINVTTALVGATATIAIGTDAGSSATSIKGATAVATYSLGAILPTVPVWTAATAFKMTALGNIIYTIAVAPLTAGVMETTVFFVHSQN